MTLTTTSVPVAFGIPDTGNTGHTTNRIEWKSQRHWRESPDISLTVDKLSVIPQLQRTCTIGKSEDLLSGRKMWLGNSHILLSCFLYGPHRDHHYHPGTPLPFELSSGAHYHMVLCLHDWISVLHSPKARTEPYLLLWAQLHAWYIVDLKNAKWKQARVLKRLFKETHRHQPIAHILSLSQLDPLQCHVHYWIPYIKALGNLNMFTTRDQDRQWRVKMLGRI